MSRKLLRDIGEGLIKHQLVDTALEQKYRKEIDTMFAEQLSGPRKMHYIVRIGMAIAIIIYLTYSLAEAPPGAVERLALSTCGIVIAALSCAYWVSIVRRGMLDRREKERMTSSLQLLAIVVVVPVVLL